MIKTVLALAALLGFILVNEVVKAAEITTPPVWRPEWPANLPPVVAADDVAPALKCTVSTETWGPKPLFRNTGAFVPAHWSQTVDLFCAHESGFYADAWGVGAWSQFAKRYAEGDLRVGWAGAIGGGFKLDVSAAWYHFHVPTVDMFNALDGRVKVSYATKFGGIDFEPYMGVDMQRNFELHSDAIAIFGGITAGFDITPEWRLSLNGDIWKWNTGAGFFPNRNATVYSVEPRLTYKISKDARAWVAAPFVHGNVFDRDDHRWKPMIKIGFAYDF